MRFYQDIILSPVITEKASKVLESYSKYCFLVHPSADKISIKAAVEKLFDVKVKKVGVAINAPKPRIFKGIQGKGKIIKKAVITLHKGFSIDAFKS